jgi:WXG100 family type VII secretion target
MSLARLGLRRLGKGEKVNTSAGGNTLSTDFDLMRSVAAAIDTRNEEIRTTLQAFIGRMSSVPSSVWGGAAAARFKDVVHRWNAESMKLHHALHGIAETIRYNEAALREAADNHAHHIGSAGGNL